MVSFSNRSNNAWDLNTALQTKFLELLNDGKTDERIQPSWGDSAIYSDNAKVVNELVQQAARELIAVLNKEDTWAADVPIMQQLWPQSTLVGGKRPITICAAQWADGEYAGGLKGLKALVKTTNGRFKEAGAGGMETVRWQHDLMKVLFDDEHRDQVVEELGKLGFCGVSSYHLITQAVLDRIDGRNHKVLPDFIIGDGNPHGINYRAAVTMMVLPVFAGRLGLNDVLHGFLGSPIWHTVYDFPPIDDNMINDGYQLAADRLNPVFDVFAHMRKVFGLEVHGGEIAFDLKTMQRLVAALDSRPEIGLGMDRSHFIWQRVNPVEVLRAFPDRIYHVHKKSVKFKLDGRNGLMRSHIPLGQLGGGWEFHSLGDGHDWQGQPEDLEPEITALNQIGYWGPLSVENEQPGAERHGRMEQALRNLAAASYEASTKSFDAGFDESNRN